MLMLSGSREITREALADIPTPEGTDTWRPVAHQDVADVLIERAEDRGLRVKSERWTVVDGQYHPEPGERVHVPGAKLFGSVDFEPLDRSLRIDLPDGLLASAGVRNSHDKSFALSVLSGARVMVCSNGMLSGEYVISRKHTSRIDLVQSIDEALDAFLESVRGLGELVGCLRARRLTQRTARAAVVEAAKAGAYPSSYILDVVRAYEEPEYREFKPRTAYSLYNACTSVMKRQPPARQVDGMKALSSVFIGTAN